MAALKKRGMNALSKQKKLLVEFVRKKPQLISGKQTATYSMKDATNDWMNITNILNSTPGAIKNWKSWRKAWHDIRSRTKIKQAKNNSNYRQTGGGPLINDMLTLLEDDVLEIIKKVSVEGHDAKESSVNFQFNDDTIIFEVESDAEEENDDEMLTARAIMGSTTIVNKNKSPIYTPLMKPSCSSTLTLTEVELPKMIKLDQPKQDLHKRHIGKKNIPKKLENLINSADAATAFKNNLNEKLDLKREYYKEKISCLKNIESLKTRKVNALESIVESLKKLAQNVSL